MWPIKKRWSESDDCEDRPVAAERCTNTNNDDDDENEDQVDDDDEGMTWPKKICPSKSDDCEDIADDDESADQSEEVSHSHDCCPRGNAATPVNDSACHSNSSSPSGSSSSSSDSDKRATIELVCRPKSRLARFYAAEASKGSKTSTSSKTSSSSNEDEVGTCPKRMSSKKSSEASTLSETRVKKSASSRSQTSSSTSSSTTTSLGEGKCSKRLPAIREANLPCKMGSTDSVSVEKRTCPKRLPPMKFVASKTGEANEPPKSCVRRAAASSTTSSATSSEANSPSLDDCGRWAAAKKGPESKTDVNQPAKDEDELSSNATTTSITSDEDSPAFKKGPSKPSVPWGSRATKGGSAQCGSSRKQNPSLTSSDDDDESTPLRVRTARHETSVTSTDEEYQEIEMICCPRDQSGTRIKLNVKISSKPEPKRRNLRQSLFTKVGNSVRVHTVTNVHPT